MLKAASFAPQCALRVTELWKGARSPSVGLHVCSTAAANGKRVQALTKAKNHALVLSEAVLDPRQGMRERLLRRPDHLRSCHRGHVVRPRGDLRPVLCIKRVDSFEQGLRIMNDSRFANGSVIYSERGHYAREIAARSDGGMVAINVGIPVALGIFGFTGHKQSFFDDLHCMGRDGFIFFTESENVTTTWFSGKAIPARVSTWDGTMTRG